MADGLIFADIVLVVDESGSMGDNQTWISSAFQSLENKLLDAHIGQNQYAVIGFGRRVSPDPRLITNLTNIGGLLSNLDSLEENGNREDGYNAINFAIGNVSFREGSTRIIVLLSDEDRDVVNSNVTRTSLFNSLVSNLIQLNVVVNATFTDSAVGVSTDGIGFFNDGAGGVVQRPGHTVISGFGSTIDDYVTLAWMLGGSAFDIKLPSQSGDIAAVFSESFQLSKKTEAIGGNDVVDTLCDFTIAPEETTFLCEVAIKDESFIRVTDPDTGSETNFLNSEFTEFVNEMSTDVCMHARISIFSDPQRTSLVSSSFSLTDQRRWFLVSGGEACVINAKGASLPAGTIPEIIFMPDVLPAALIEQQMKHSIEENVVERPLVCGVRYYITLEAYVVDTFYKIKDSTFQFKCIDTERRFWRDNLDAETWVSSGQGQNDVRISQTTNQALLPSVAVNNFGHFAVAWEDFRDNPEDGLNQVSDIFYGIWEPSKNEFWSSGQGHADVRAVHNAFTPLSIADPAMNFVFSGISALELKLNRCLQPTPDAVAPKVCVFSDDEIFDIDNTNRDSDQYLKIRIYEPDVFSSFALSDRQTVSVIRDCFVRLDIVGAPGTYAFRLRNEDDNDWSSWINIDNRLPAGADNGPGTPEETGISAYFIDNDRFIAPWVLSPGNGIKRVCAQILTYFGITKTFCMEAMANISEIEYKVEFFYDATFETPVEVFNGLPAIRNRGGSGTQTSVYVRITFTDPDRLSVFDQLQSLNKFKHLANNEFTFNFIQQGVNDQYALRLTAVSGQEGVFSGSFNIQSSDGIYNKDGLSAIVVNIPNPCTKLRDMICAGNAFDALNLNRANILEDFTTAYGNLQSIDANNVFERLKSSKLANLTDLVAFKQLYDVDDPRFTFGNPKFFIKQ